MTKQKLAAAPQTISVAVMPAEDLVPSPRNSRRHSSEQIAQIKASIREFGYTTPILHDGYEIVAGHGRRQAVMEMYAAGETIRLPSGQALPAGTVPVIDCSGWSEEQRRAYVIADNKIAENATWDEDLLKLELTFLDASAFDVTLTGLDDRALAAALSNDQVGIAKGKDEGRSGAKSLNLVVGKQQIPLTVDEHNALLDAVDEYVEANGALYGFASHLLDGLRALAEATDA